MCSRNEIARCSRKLDFRKLVHFLFPFFFRVPHSLCVEMIAAWNEYPLESNRAIEIVCKMINRVEVLLGSFLSLHLPLSQSSITIFPVHACLFFLRPLDFLQSEFFDAISKEFMKNLPYIWRVWAGSRGEWKSVSTRRAPFLKYTSPLLSAMHRYFSYFSRSTVERLINKNTIWVRILIDTNVVNTLFYFIFLRSSKNETANNKKRKK